MTYTNPSWPTPMRGLKPAPTLVTADQLFALSDVHTRAGSWSAASKLRQVEYTWSPPPAPVFTRSAAMCSWSAKHAPGMGGAGGVLSLVQTTALLRKLKVCPLSVETVI